VRPINDSVVILYVTNNSKYVYLSDTILSSTVMVSQIPQSACQFNQKERMTHSMPVHLLLDPNTLVLPLKGWVYVFNRKGLTKIKGHYIDKVHERLKSYLDGTYQEQELMSAVAVEKQEVLRKYFDAMSQAGALQRRDSAQQKAPSTVHAEFLLQNETGPDGHNMIVTINGKATCVSLDGQYQASDGHGRRYDACLQFLSASQMDTEWKRVWRAPKNGAHMLYIVKECASALPLDETEIERRKRYAIWLLGCLGIDSWNRRTVQLYTFDSATFALTPCFAGSLDDSAGKKEFNTELVSPTDHKQLPLAIAKAAVPFYSNAAAGCGLHYTLLAQELEREFIVQATLASETKKERMPFVTEFRDWRRSKPELRRARVNRRQVSGWPVAGSLLHLRVRASERFWWKMPAHVRNGSSRDIDLLQSGEEHAQLAYIANILRTRLPTLSATMKSTTCGLYVCQSGKYFAYSFVQPKAIRDVLLAIIKDEFYGESLRAIETKHECDYDSFLTEEQLRRLVLRQSMILKKHKISTCFTFRHVQRVEISAWIGRLSHEN
jgi:hypothetical protein